MTPRRLRPGGALRAGDPHAAARAILAAALVRAILHPGGLTSERIGEYAYTLGETPADSAVLTEEKRDALAGLCGTSPATAGASSVPLWMPPTVIRLRPQAQPVRPRPPRSGA